MAPDPQSHAARQRCYQQRQRDGADANKTPREIGQAAPVPILCNDASYPNVSD
jgi:hypothetical protein